MTEFAGLEVTWTDWAQGVRVLCLDTSCTGCGHPGAAWCCRGLVPHTPDAATRAELRRDASAAGRAVPRWPQVVARLFAFACPSCRATRVYDTGPTGGSWREVDLVQPSLFDIPAP